MPGPAGGQLGAELTAAISRRFPASTCTYQTVQESRAARYGAWPTWVHPGVREHLADEGITRLFSHQSATAEHAWRGEDVVVATGTSSGKSLGYLLPILSALADTPNACALYLTPTKALGSDQLQAVSALTRAVAGLDTIHPAPYDGDTPTEARGGIRDASRFIFTNPDMLHVSVLAHHQRWARLLRHLRFIVVDECHRGSAREESKWRRILEYFNEAIHVGMTATPKESNEVSNITYFGDPVYTYSLKQGIDDGFLAPYKVIRIGLDKDLEGWRPYDGQRDVNGQLIEDREYNLTDYDRKLVIDDRTKAVANRITKWLVANGRFSKSIIFCVDIEHAERMRQALVNENQDLVSQNPKYIMRITGDNPEGKAQLDYFIDVNEKYPTLVTTSKLMSTGVDVKTCKLIVLDNSINSMTEFKQIIGRGTRLYPEYDKNYFTILDFRNASRLFAEPEFDGKPIVIIEGGDGGSGWDPGEENEPIIEGEPDEEQDQADQGRNHVIGREQVGVVPDLRADFNGQLRHRRLAAAGCALDKEVRRLGLADHRGC